MFKLIVSYKTYTYWISFVVLDFQMELYGIVVSKCKQIETPELCTTETLEKGQGIEEYVKLP